MGSAVSFSSSSGLAFRFGQFEADVARNTLTRNGVRVKIQDQPFRVLLLLLERPNEIFTRDELRQKLWPEGTYVDFDGSLNVVFKKLRAALDDDSENPRFIETVPRRGYRFIAPVSIIKGKGESGSVPIAVETAPTGAVAALPAATDGSADIRSSRHSAYRALIAAAAVLLVLGGLGWFQYHKHSIGVPLDASAHVQLRKSVAVLGFHNVSGRAEDAWLGTAFPEMLRTELSGGEKLRLVAGEEIANLRLSSPWPETDSLDRGTTARIGAALNSDLLVLGSYITASKAQSAQLRIDVRLQDAKSGEILTEIAQTGDRNELFQLISGVGSKLRTKLGVPQLDEPQQASVVASLPSNREAARLYALGVTKLREFDGLAAKDLLQQACNADPKFALGHAMLARAWNQLGYEQNRKQEANRALKLSANLPRADRMQVEGDYYEALPDHERAASVYHALFELFPDSVDYGLQLAWAQNAGGHGAQATETLHQLRRLPLPASDDPRIDLMEERAIGSNKRAMLVIIRNAIRKSTAQGKRLVYAQARKEECMALIYGDEPDQGIPACKEAYDIYFAAGNRPGAADALRLIGDRQGTQGHVDDALATYQRALDVLHGLGEHNKTGAILNNMANLYLNEGKIDQAEQFFRQALAHWEQGGEKYDAVVALVNLADVAYLRGNLQGATKLYKQDLDDIAKLDRTDPGYTLYRLADLKLAQGQVKEAHQLAKQAVDSIRPPEGDYQYLTAAMLVVGDALMAEGELAGARKQYDETLAIRQRMGFMELVAKSQVELAQLAINEGHPEQAEQLARAAIAQFEKKTGDSDTASAYTVLSRALVAQSKLEDARKAVEQATALSKASPDPELRLTVQIQKTAVEVAAAPKSGAAAAGRELRSAINTAKKLGYYDLECEGRLALGELEIAKNPAEARAELTTLAADARRHGLELLAQKAERAIAHASLIAAATPKP